MDDEIIQYAENGIFYDFIYKHELKHVLYSRILIGKNLLTFGHRQEIAKYLRVFVGIHTKEDMRRLLSERLNSLNRRLEKILAKEKADG